jgi:uncharacterized Zn-finger protein
MNITEAEQSLIVTTTLVSCDGGGGSSGHPNVYLNVGIEGKISCPYCSQVFVLARGNVDGLSH